MKLEQSFEVAAPVEQVWQALIDVERVAPCLPGASVTGRNDDGSYAGTFTVKIGPTSATYTGKLEMENIDEGAHTATMQANGTDKRGQGGAKATIISTLSPAGDGGTRVEVNTDYHITGRLARFGRGGMIEDISEKLLRQFAQSLQASMGPALPPDEPAPIKGATPDELAPSNGAEPEAAVAEEQAAAEGPPGAGETEAAPEVGPAAEAAPSPAGEVGPAAEAPPSPEPPAPQAPPAPEVAEAPQAPPAPDPTWTPPAPAEPVQGLSLVGSVMWDRTRRNPKPALAFLFGSLLAFIALRRARR